MGDKVLSAPTEALADGQFLPRWWGFLRDVVLPGHPTSPVSRSAVGRRRLSRIIQCSMVLCLTQQF